MGGRSRVAAQIMAGKGFDDVYNLPGGFRAWKSEAAFGLEEHGLELFTGNESPEKTLVAAYSLEEGLRDFYLSMAPKVKNDDARDLFEKLSEIEIKHQDRIFNEYLKIAAPISRKEFESNIVADAVEGGLTTSEYAELFQPDWESVRDIVELAMSIEAQAMDLYMRASEKSTDAQSKYLLIKIADEEREHMTLLGGLMDAVSIEGS